MTFSRFWVFTVAFVAILAYGSVSMQPPVPQLRVGEGPSSDLSIGSGPRDSSEKQVRYQNSEADVTAALKKAKSSGLFGELNWDYISEYSSYMHKFGKLDNYVIDGSDGFSEIVMRYKNYLWSVNYINDYNKRKNRNLGHTKFSDWTKDEKYGLINTKEEMQALSIVAHDTCYSFTGWGEQSSSYTSFVDECQSIKDQGSCGSCWDFSSTGQFEVNNDLYNSVYESYSEQYILDCVDDTIGTCDGGWPTDTDEWITDNGHCPTDDYYSYDGLDTWSCEDCFDTKTYPDGSACLSSDDFETAVDTASYVALSYWMGIDDSFYYLDTSDYTYFDCDDGIIGYHAMTIVGQWSYSSYTYEYLYVRNSWGDDWGYYGYFWLADSTEDTCEIQDFAFNYWYTSKNGLENIASKIENLFGLSSDNVSVEGINKPFQFQSHFVIYSIFTVIGLLLITMFARIIYYRCKQDVKTNGYQPLV